MVSAPCINYQQVARIYGIITLYVFPDRSWWDVISLQQWRLDYSSDGHNQPFWWYFRNLQSYFDGDSEEYKWITYSRRADTVITTER